MIHLARMGLCFSAGIVMARAYHLKGAAAQIAPASWLAAGASLWSIIALAIDELAIFSVFGFTALIYALALGGGTIERALTLPLVLFLGRVSFSLYLSHFILQAGMLWYFWEGVGKTNYPVIATGVLVGVPVAIAAVLYYAVERPSHALGRKLAQGFRARAGQLH